MADKKPILTTAPSLIGDKVYLRPMTAEDVANTHHWFLMSEPQLMTCRALPIATAAEAAEAYKKMEHASDRERFMIVRNSDNVPVGRVQYFDLNGLNRSAEFGLLVDPDERGKGYGREGTRVLCRYLFRMRGLNKVYAQTASFNEATIKLLESVGFRRDGTLRQHYFADREFHDGLVYSLLAFEADNL